ncbi:ribosome recycling factor [Helicobacter pylori]|nr:ribosome recycling factor [Helicobacter pylori]
MLQAIYNETKDLMQKSVQALNRDFSTLRSAKVSVNILDHIKVDYYGTPTALNQVGSVMSLDATTLQISPWEKTCSKKLKDPFKKPILASILITTAKRSSFFPAHDNRAKKTHRKRRQSNGEKAKVAVRNIRQDANNQVKKLEKDKEISEDESKKAQEQIQKITDEAIKKIDESVKNKEYAILKV